MQNISRHILIPPHAKHIRAYSYSPACRTYPGIFLFPPHAKHIRAYSYPLPRIQNISGIFLSPSPTYKTYPEHILIPLPRIQNISGAYSYSPPRIQTEPEHVFDCPHVCDGCTVRTDAIRHERTDVRKTRWTMKMYSGSVPSGNPIIRFSSFPLRESNYPLLQLPPLPGIQLSASPASPSGNPIIRFPPGQHTLSYFPRAVLQIRSTHAIIPSEELSSTRSYPRLSSQRMHVFAL